jgi:cell division protein FtsZ
MSHMGRSVMGMGVAKGENRAIEAAKIAISSPLLEESSIEGARGVLLNVTGGPDLSLHEVNDASSIIQKVVDPDANIIFGSVISEQMGDEVRVTVIATGFEEPESKKIPEKEVVVPIHTTRAPVSSGIKIREVVREDLRQEDLRREEHTEEVRAELRGLRQKGSLFSEDEWDIPTFIRNQAD